MTLSEKLRTRATELSNESRFSGDEWTATLLEQAAEQLDLFESRTEPLRAAIDRLPAILPGAPYLLDEAIAQLVALAEWREKGS